MRTSPDGVPKAGQVGVQNPQLATFFSQKERTHIGTHTNRVARYTAVHTAVYNSTVDTHRKRFDK